MPNKLSSLEYAFEIYVSQVVDTVTCSKSKQGL